MAALPDPPPLSAGTDGSVDDWVRSLFAETEHGLACLKCAALIVPGEQFRHWSELHMPFRGGL